MKILHVITSLHTGGAENLVVQFAPLLRGMGHEVDVLLHDGADTPFKQKLVAAGIKVMALGEQCNVYKPSFIYRLIPIVKRYDLVHTHNTASQLFVAMAAKLGGAKCKLVTTEHSTDNRRRHLWWCRPIDRWMYRQYDAIISISETATQLLQEYLHNGTQVKTISNGVDCDMFRNALPQQELRTAGDVIVAMVAGFRQEKDQDTLIRAMQQLPQHYKLWLIGDGVRRGECEQIAAELQLGDRVKFWGVRSDVPQLLQTADVLVMSTHYEGMSLSNIEGMATGKPFIASDVNGVREITQGAGILFPEGDDRQLAHEIERVTTDADYCAQVVARCTARAAQYDINKTASSYNEVYQNLK